MQLGDLVGESELVLTNDGPQNGFLSASERCSLRRQPAVNLSLSWPILALLSQPQSSAS